MRVRGAVSVRTCLKIGLTWTTDDQDWANYDRMNVNVYPTDLTDEQLQYLQPMLPPPQATGTQVGRPVAHLQRTAPLI